MRAVMMQTDTLQKIMTKRRRELAVIAGMKMMGMMAEGQQGMLTWQMLTGQILVTQLVLVLLLLLARHLLESLTGPLRFWMTLRKVMGNILQQQQQQ
jgi:hypothetical protein